MLGGSSKHLIGGHKDFIDVNSGNENDKWISKLESNSFDDVKSFITKNGHSIIQALSEAERTQNFFNLKRVPSGGFYRQDSGKDLLKDILPRSQISSQE